MAEVKIPGRLLILLPLVGCVGTDLCRYQGKGNRLIRSHQYFGISSKEKV